MALSIQIRPLEAPTGPTARSRRYPLVHGERPYVAPRGPQLVAHVFEELQLDTDTLRLGTAGVKLYPEGGGGTCRSGEEYGACTEPGRGRGLLSRSWESKDARDHIP